ncbi:3-hydroxyacyl-CoA dehydrogenase NAD-binding domain-containing protein [Paraburkholderia nemoris]|uniref:3-hydroxyacyl-CoA dehydrogenase NAD-binding domain-containing protein n=1 Tax=Paraburkholderia nemoris TaxID=2793076 RepID=UPI0038B703BE
MTITEAQRKVAVAHADPMGCGIASVFALAGLDIVCDLAPLEVIDAKQNCHAVFLELAVARVISQSQVATAEGGVRSVKSIAELNEAAPAIETIVKSVDARQSLYFALEGVLSETAILACSTSGIVPEVLSEHLRRPGRFLVAHFWDAPHIIPLVEVGAAPRIGHDTVAATMEWLTAANCKPVLLSKAVLGFIGNRLQFCGAARSSTHASRRYCRRGHRRRSYEASLGRRYRWSDRWKVPTSAASRLSWPPDRNCCRI